MLVIGIDPGVTGAVAAVSDTGFADLADIPVRSVYGAATVSRRVCGFTLRTIIATLVEQAGPDAGSWVVACEAVHAREGDRNSMQSQGSLMRSLGAIEAVADVMGCPPTLVAPQAWQGFYGLVGKEQDARERREQRLPGAPPVLPQSVQLARTLFPRLAGMLTLVKHHNRGEALLIARYHLRKTMHDGNVAG